ncbi:MAG: MFS transporter, partial [Bacillota bacterium]
SRDLGLSAASLGNLSAFYYYSYAAIQIPTGILVDRWGPRRILSIGASLTALGTLLFALAPTVGWACAGRLAIGAAGGVAFVSMLKLATHWMPRTRFAFVSGLALFMGVLGGTLAGVPLRIAVDAFGWRGVMVASAAVTAIVAAAIVWVVRDDPRDRGFASYYPQTVSERPRASISASFLEALRYPNVVLTPFITAALSSIVLTFAGLWGVPFLVTTQGFTRTQAAATATAMLIAWSLASMAYGPLSERFGRRKPVFLFGLIASIAVWSLVLYVPGWSKASLVALLVAASVTSGAFIIAFAFAKESAPAHLGGTVSGFANMGAMLGGMAMQPVVGIVLDARWAGRSIDGVRVFDFEAYQAGFGLVIAWCAIGLLLLAFTRETYCRPFR